MRKDWLGAIFAFPSVILDELVEAVRRILTDEKETLEGSEYDDEE